MGRNGKSCSELGNGMAPKRRQAIDEPHDDVIKWKHFLRNWPFVREFTGHGEFPAQRPVTQSFDVFFDLCLTKRLSKQWRGWWFETPSRPLWRHCNVWSRISQINNCSTTSTSGQWVIPLYPHDGLFLVRVQHPMLNVHLTLLGPCVYVYAFWTGSPLV